MWISTNSAQKNWLKCLYAWFFNGCTQALEQDHGLNVH